jgi:hypothetical protein
LRLCGFAALRLCGFAALREPPEIFPRKAAKAQSFSKHDPDYLFPLTL